MGIAFGVNINTKTPTLNENKTTPINWLVKLNPKKKWTVANWPNNLENGKKTVKSPD